MVDGFIKSMNALMNGLPPIGKRKSPNWACAIGFLTGGIGLSIYFRSFVDLIIPIALAIVTTLVVYKLAGVLGIGTLGGSIVAALYGYFRVLNSNSRLEALTSEVVTTQP